MRELERATRGMRNTASDTAVQHTRLSITETISMLNGAYIMLLPPAPEQLTGHITTTHGLHEAAKGGTARGRWRGPGARPPTAASRRPPRRPRSRARALCCQLRGLSPSTDAAAPAYAHTLATSLCAVAALRPGGCEEDAAPILLARTGSRTLGSCHQPKEHRRWNPLRLFWQRRHSFFASPQNTCTAIGLGRC